MNEMSHNRGGENSGRREQRVQLEMAAADSTSAIDESESDADAASASVEEVQPDEASDEHVYVDI